VSRRLGGVGTWGDSAVICISELIIVRSIIYIIFPTVYNPY